MNKNFDVNYSKYIQKLYRKQDTELSNDNNQVPHKYSVLEREDLQNMKHIVLIQMVVKMRMMLLVFFKITIVNFLLFI